MSGADLEEAWNRLNVKTYVIHHLFYDNTSNVCNSSNSKSHTYYLPKFFNGLIYDNGIFQITRLDFTPAKCPSLNPRLYATIIFCMTYCFGSSDVLLYKFRRK